MNKKDVEFKNVCFKEPEYSKEKVLKNVKYTAIWAVIILITIVLPAEYGIDPTGFWKMTWLTKLAPNYIDENVEQCSETELSICTGTKKEENIEQSFEEAIKIVEKSEENKEENKETSNVSNKLEKTYTIPAKGNVEIKFKMNKWDEMTFNWESSELVYFDQHWEPTTREWKQFLPYKTVKDWKQNSDGWNIVAEFTWTHGWYWRNLSNNEMTVKLSLNGTFEEK